MTEPFLRLDHLTKAFGANVVARDVNLTFEKGEFISLLGPSGCGKTTILRMVAGFERPTSGSVIMDGQDITHLKPNQRKLGMVFQAYALFPNMSVADNIAFGLKVAGQPRDVQKARVAEMLKLIGLAGKEKFYPFELSGGQQQRVALARAIAPSPRMLLLDEPLSALDAKIRVSLRQEIRQIQRELGITTIFVTHDQEEALSISDRIVVMNAGNVEQVGDPFSIYNRPASRFVANFVGTLSTLQASVTDAASKVVSVDGHTITLPGLADGLTNGSTVTLALRPEAVTLGPRADRTNTLTGKVDEVSFLGSVIRLRVSLGANSISFDTFNDQQTPPPAIGDTVTLSLSGSDILTL